MDHKCPHESTIGEMHGLLKRIVTQVYGNGQEGLATSVPKLSSKIETLSEDIVLLSTNVSGLMRFMSETQGAKSQEEKDEIRKDRASFSSRQKVSIIVSAILGFTAIIVTVILKFI